MKPLCLDGDDPQYAVRRDEGWTEEDAARLQAAIWVSVPLGLLVWAVIGLAFAWVLGWVP